MSWFIIFFLAISVGSTLHPNFYFDRLASVIAENHDAYIKLSSAEDAIHFNDLQPTLTSILFNSPLALVSALFRPLIFEANTILKMMESIENLFFLTLTILALWNYKRWTSRTDLVNLAVLVYIILLAVFLALSTPNFGSLSRFRIGFTPFLSFMLLCGSDFFNRAKGLLTGSK